MNIVTTLKALADKFPSLFREDMTQEQFEQACDSLLTREEVSAMIQESIDNITPFDTTSVENSITALNSQLDVKNPKSIASAVQTLSTIVTNLAADVDNLSTTVAELSTDEIQKDLIEDEGNPFMSTIKKEKSNGVTVVKIEGNPLVTA
jgi:hypothetical protein